MRDLAGFRDAVEQYRKQVGRTEEELARELYVSKGELNKRLHDYSHPQSKRTWRLQPRHVKTIVETLPRWGAITARRQAFTLFTLIDFPALAEEIDWQAAPWNKLHVDALPTKPSPPLSVPPHRRIFQARDLPKDYVPRPNASNEIKHLLLAHEGNQTTAITTALRGAGGFGKTTLALALCHDPEIQATFPDGILWVELGEHPPRPLDILNGKLHALEPVVPEALTLEEARDRWRNALEERACLLVIDDVWQTEALEELLHGGPHCRRLVTTRNDQVLPEDTTRVWVDAMEPDEAMTLLCQGWVENGLHTLSRAVLEYVVVQQLGCWPLLVSLARGMLTTQVKRLGKTPEQALLLVKHAYEERGMAAFHLGDRIERQRTADACVDVNLRQLEEWVPAHYQVRQRYLELAVFPEDTYFPLTTLQTYWRATGGLHAWEVEELCLRLSDLSLVLPWDAEQGTIRLHDVLRSYLIQRAWADLPLLHGRLLDAYQQEYGLTRWADLPRSEAYLWQHLALHLCQAGRPEALQTTLTDLSYLTRKALFVGVAALESDLLLARMQEEAGATDATSTFLVSLHRTIVRISHLLRQVATEAEMGGLLLSHLGGRPPFVTQRGTFERELARPFLTAWHPLPETSSPALICTLYGHTSWVTDCAVSMGGRTIVSASQDDTLKVWDGTTGEERFTLLGHSGTVNGCAVTPDGRTIVSASYDNTLKVWDGITGEERFTLSGHRGVVFDCAVSADGRTIVSASIDQTLKVWDGVTGEERFTLSGLHREVWGCAVSADGCTIVSASGNLKIWDGITGEERLTLSGHALVLTDCAVSADGCTIVSASHDNTLKVWDASTGEERLTLSGHRFTITGCAVSPDGRTIVSASQDDTLKVWDVGTEKMPLTNSSHHQVRSCAVSWDRRTVLSASDDCRLTVWDGKTGEKRLTLPGITLSGLSFPISGCATSLDGRTIVSASWSGKLQLWNGITGEERLTISTGHQGAIYGCAISLDGRTIVSAANDGTLKVWNAGTGKKRFTLSGHRDAYRRSRMIGSCAVTACAVTLDGRTIVSASTDHTLKVWDMGTRKERLTLSGHRGEVKSCAVSGDGGTIVSASTDHTLKVWDGDTGEELLTLLGHRDDVIGCAVSGDGQTIVSVSEDNTLKVWEMQSGRCLLTFPVDGPLYGCAFHPEGEYLVACGMQGLYFLRLVM